MNQPPFGKVRDDGLQGTTVLGQLVLNGHRLGVEHRSLHELIDFKLIEQVSVGTFHERFNINVLGSILAIQESLILLSRWRNLPGRLS